MYSYNFNVPSSPWGEYSVHSCLYDFKWTTSGSENVYPMVYLALDGYIKIKGAK